MKEQYIKKVKRNLMLSGKRKREIVRDLQEAFASGQEHGETEEQVAERLGAPEAFAESVLEQLGPAWAERRRRKERVQIGAALAIAVAAFLTGGLIRLSAPAKNVIGQGDALTEIQVSGTALSLPDVLLLLGAAALAAAAVLVLRRERERRRKDEKD